jgi:hypothetical protein
VDEDLLILFIPGVDGVPVEGDVVLQWAQVAGGLRIAPGKVLLGPGRAI